MSSVLQFLHLVVAAFIQAQKSHKDRAVSRPPKGNKGKDKYRKPLLPAQLKAEIQTYRSHIGERLTTYSKT